MRKLIAMSLSMMMVMITATACSSSKGGKPAAKADEKVALSICSADNTFGLSTDADLQKSVIELVENKTNTDIKAIIPPLASYNEKLETMISGGDVPDIFCVSQAMTRLPNHIVRGKVLKLNEYIEKSELLSSIDKSLYDALSTNGDIYHIPYLYPKVKVLFLRKDIMEKYNIDLSHTPTTEEFSKEMSKLVGTGVTPFSFPKWIDNFQFFFNSYGAYAGVYKNAEGKYVDGFQEPQMVDALNYLRGLYTSKVLNQEFITTENATMRENVYTGKSASDIDYVTNYTNYILQSSKAGAESDVFPIYSLVGPSGKSGALNESVQTCLSISADCKDPERAIKVIEALVFDPEVYAAFWNIGVEGAHYTVDSDGSLKPTEKATNSGYAPTYTYLYDSFIKEFNFKFKVNAKLQEMLPNQTEFIKQAQTAKGPKYAVPAGISDTYDQVSSSITSTWQETVSQVILGTVSVEQGMANYKNYWNSVNGETILKELNAAK